jgi:regulator of replication initiation timing
MCFAYTIFAGTISFVLAGLPAWSDTIDDVSAVAATVDSFYCTSSDGEARMIIFAHPKGGAQSNLLMYPEGFPSRKIGGIFTADLPDGTLSLDDGNYVSMTSDGVESGICKTFDGEIIEFIKALAAADPEMLAGEVRAAAMADDKTRIAVLESQISDLTPQVSKLEYQLERLRSDAKLRFDRQETAYRANLAAQTFSYRKVAKEVENLTPLSDDNKKLKRENEKLKRRICEMDPKATFSVCKDGRAP